MADYNKQTVAQLRQLLKDRGIPSTGLQRKAQIVEKLEEADLESGSSLVGDNGNEDAPEPKEVQDAPAEDMPLDAVEQVAKATQDDEHGSENQQQQVPGPELSQVGGK